MKKSQMIIIKLLVVISLITLTGCLKAKSSFPDRFSLNTFGASMAEYDAANEYIPTDVSWKNSQLGDIIFWKKTHTMRKDTSLRTKIDIGLKNEYYEKATLKMVITEHKLAEIIKLLTLDFSTKIPSRKSHKLYLSVDLDDVKRTSIQKSNVQELSKLISAKGTPKKDYFYITVGKTIQASTVHYHVPMKQIKRMRALNALQKSARYGDDIKIVGNEKVILSVNPVQSRPFIFQFMSLSDYGVGKKSDVKYLFNPDRFLSHAKLGKIEESLD